MFEILKKILQTGTVTETIHFPPASERFRGKPIFISDACTSCGECVSVCPADAIQIQRYDTFERLELSYAKCIFCGICAEVCEPKIIEITNEYRLAAHSKEDLLTYIDLPQKPQAL